MSKYRNMAGILKALGFESKPEYAEKIPETLTPEDFSVHRVSYGYAVGA